MSFKKFKSLFKFFLNKSKTISKFDIFISILGITCYYFGYYFIILYALLHLIVRVLQTFSETFATKLITFKNDQEIIKRHYLEDFNFWYYLIMIDRVITACFYLFFFYYLNPNSLAQYSFVFYIITYIFVLANLIDLGIIIYIILYKNDPTKEALLSLCYHCVTKGVPAFGAFHMSCNVPMIAPNPVSNFYHKWSPIGRGYGAYSSGQLLQVDFIQTKLGANFDYKQCLDSSWYLDPEKLESYAEKHDIEIPKLSLEHTHFLGGKKSK